jgi:hypothetical protein
MATTPRKGKNPQDKTVGISITRPKWLADKVDKVIRKMAVELNQDLYHSEVVCALEQLMIENPEVYQMVCAKVLRAKN